MTTGQASVRARLLDKQRVKNVSAVSVTTCQGGPVALDSRATCPVRTDRAGSYPVPMTDYLQVSTVADSRDTAAKLARAAVAAKLAAGAQVHGPVASFFWHKGESGEAEEWQVTLKTTAGCYPELEALLLGEHTWENPEVTAIPLVAGTAAYFEWLQRTVSGE